jgi:hypothetical protein
VGVTKSRYYGGVGLDEGWQQTDSCSSVMDAPAAFQMSLINSDGFLMSLVVDMLFTEFNNFTRKTNLVFWNLQIGGFHIDAKC